MKILVVCDHGNNRSVAVAHALKYNHDVLSAGVKKNSTETLEMLYNWSDMIIRTHTDQIIPEAHQEKVKTLPIGPDIFPRNAHPHLQWKIKDLLKKNQEWFI